MSDPPVIQVGDRRVECEFCHGTGGRGGGKLCFFCGGAGHRWVPIYDAGDDPARAVCNGEPKLFMGAL